MFRFFFDVLTFYLPPIEENRRFKKPRSCILRDISLLQLTEVSDAFRHWPITFLVRSTGHRVTPTSFGSEFLAMAQACVISPNFSQLGLRPRGLRIKRYHARFRAIMVKYYAQLLSSNNS